MEPIAIRVELSFGELFRERNAVCFAKGAGFTPGVTFDFDAFQGGLVGEMTKESMGKFVKKKKAKVFVVFKIENRFFRAEEEFSTRFKGKIREVGF